MRLSFKIKKADGNIVDRNYNKVSKLWCNVGDTPHTFSFLWGEEVITDPIPNSGEELLEFVVEEY